MVREKQRRGGLKRKAQLDVRPRGDLFDWEAHYIFMRQCARDPKLRAAYKRYLADHYQELRTYTRAWRGF